MRTAKKHLWRVSKAQWETGCIWLWSADISFRPTYLYLSQGGTETISFHGNNNLGEVQTNRNSHMLCVLMIVCAKVLSMRMCWLLCSGSVTSCVCMASFPLSPRSSMSCNFRSSTSCARRPTPSLSMSIESSSATLSMEMLSISMPMWVLSIAIVSVLLSPWEEWALVKLIPGPGDFTRAAGAAETADMGLEGVAEPTSAWLSLWVGSGGTPGTTTWSPVA